MADLNVNGGSAVYTLVDPYKEFAVYADDRTEHTFDGMTAEESNALAKKIAAKAENPAESAVTDANGNASFTVSDNGMYLAVETDKKDKAAGYETADPFFVSVPEADPETGKWIYQAEAKPKTEADVLPVPKVKKHKVETSVDSSQAKRYIRIFAESGIVCFILGVVLLKQRRKEDPQA